MQNPVFCLVRIHRATKTDGTDQLGIGSRLCLISSTLAALGGEGDPRPESMCRCNMDLARGKRPVSRANPRTCSTLPNHISGAILALRGHVFFPRSPRGASMSSGLAISGCQRGSSVVDGEEINEPGAASLPHGNQPVVIEREDRLP